MAVRSTQGQNRAVRSTQWGEGVSPSYRGNPVCSHKKVLSYLRLGFRPILELFILHMLTVCKHWIARKHNLSSFSSLYAFLFHVSRNMLYKPPLTIFHIHCLITHSLCILSNLLYRCLLSRENSRK